MLSSTVIFNKYGLRVEKTESKIAAVRTKINVNLYGRTYRMSLLKRDTSKIEPVTLELISQIYALDNLLFLGKARGLEQSNPLDSDHGLQV